MKGSQQTQSKKMQQQQQHLQKLQKKMQKLTQQKQQIMQDMTKLRQQLQQQQQKRRQLMKEWSQKQLEKSEKKARRSNYQTDIEEKYGERSVILMMVGSFYEMYEYEGVGHASKMSAMLNITLTKKDKKKELSRTNPYMCGFPSHSLRKFVDILVRQFGYTVGIVDQMEDNASSSSSKQKRRDLAKVYSPCIPYEYDFESDNDIQASSVDAQIENVCLVYSIQRQARNHLSKDQRFFLSYIVLNLTFGNVFYGEEDFASFVDVRESLDRLCMKERVQEVLVLETSHKLESMHFSDEGNLLIHRHDQLEGKYRLLSYQQKVLSRVYRDAVEETVIDELDLERHPSIVQYLVFLFDFVYDHCPLVLSKLKRPVPMKTRSHLHYNIRSYYELNVLNQRVMDRRRNATEVSLMDMVDKTCTPMGSRWLRHLFFVPTYDVSELEARYDRVEAYIRDRKVLSERRLVMNTIGDMEKKYRSMCLDRISPKDMAQVLRTIHTLVEHASFRTMIPLDTVNQLHALLEWTRKQWDLSRMEESRTVSKIEQNFFLYPDENILELTRIYEKDHEHLTSFVRRTQEMCQLRFGMTDDVSIVTTKRKWTTFRYQLEKEGVHAVDTRTSICTLHSPTLDTCTARMQTTMQRLRELWKERFSADVKVVCRLYGHTIEELCQWISQEDVYMSFAHVSIFHRYCRPSIVSTPSSFLNARDIRHPIIERVQENERFVENDVCLNDEKMGMLVYGLNSAGKSTLIKSVGLAVVMAQIGMFVPCSKFEFQPFQTLLSKIFVMDNIYKAQSTFLYELNELKTILQQCSPHSLVLCDELTSGTETYSATGLMASTLLHCVREKTRFIFTTHLHTLASIDEITTNPSLQIVHFAVSVDNGRIQYDRKIAKGMGSSLYGIEIADALGFPSSFTKVAFDIRNRVSGERQRLVQDHRSRYNKRMIMDACSRCGKHLNLHTHHIIPQKASDEDGYIGTFHKNRSFNLEVLCKDCHIEEHHSPTSSNPFSKYVFQKVEMDDADTGMSVLR